MVLAFFAMAKGFLFSRTTIQKKARPSFKVAL